MIEGKFGNKGELFFEIELITQDGLSLTVEAMLDTGFTEFLAINKQDIEGLEWPFIRKNELRTAQGLSIFDIYLGKLLLDGQEFVIPVFAGDEIQEILLGSQWLSIFDLVVKFREGVLTLQ
jgi:predicted aspartyl protease